MSNIEAEYQMLNKSLLACTEFWQLENLFDKLADFIDTVDNASRRALYRQNLWQTYRVMEQEIKVKQSKPIIK
jgi:hypothetical protein